MSATIIHTWHPISLNDADSAPPEPPNISGVIYPERTHVWSGEPETLKSMVAMAIALEQIRHGRYAAYIDYENGIRETTSRLRALGATDDDLSRLLYYQPDEPLSEDIRMDVQAQFAEHQPAFVTIDSYTGSLALHGFDPNKSVDVELHHKVVIHPLRASGAGVVLLDHLVKNRENRGRYSIGSERKIGVCDVHISFELILPLSRGHKGVVKLVTHKDRPGYLHRPKAAQATFTSTAAGDLTWTLEPAEDAPLAAISEFRPTRLMERVSRYLELHGAAASQTNIEETVLGNAGYLRKAIDALVREGYCAESIGPRKARMIEHVQDYRESSEQTTNGHDPVLTPSSLTITTPSPTPSNTIPHEYTENATPSNPVLTPSPVPDPTPSSGALSPTGGAPERDGVSGVPKQTENEPELDDETAYYASLFATAPELDEEALSEAWPDPDAPLEL